MQRTSPDPRTRRTARGAAAATASLALLGLLAACGAGEPARDATTPSATSAGAASDTTPSATPTPSPTPTPTPTPTRGADLTLAEKAGQLVMVGVDANAPQDAAYAAVRDQHVGGIFVAGRSSAGVDAVADLVSSFTDLVDPTGPGGPLLVATDQEGGAVQVLKGPGFSTIPSAVTQSGWPVETIQARATGWGAELAAAGITLNLAPVMDVVPAGTAGSNPPVGVFGRQYGDDAHRVAINANAFSAGMEASGVDVAIKHFPGLGLVDANTDTTAHVVDDQTDASSPSVEAFRAGIDDGAAVVMMATAVYTRLDPDNPAAFSHDVVTGLLRDELGFDRVCMTDDVSAAVQVADVDPGQRAVRTIAAGCDLVLASAKPEMAATMVDAIVARAEEDPEFAAQVDASVERVLAMKQRLR